jgi:hypothetical protein
MIVIIYVPLVLSVFIILDERPFSLLIISSRRSVARDYFQFYMDEKQKLKAFFKSDCNMVALTTNCWTSIQNINYLPLRQTLLIINVIIKNESLVSQ